jgi:hypothetical protein
MRVSDDVVRTLDYTRDNLRSASEVIERSSFRDVTRLGLSKRLDRRRRGYGDPNLNLALVAGKSRLWAKLEREIYEHFDRINEKVDGSLDDNGERKRTRWTPEWKLGSRSATVRLRR